jgi:hypothetical protein
MAASLPQANAPPTTVTEMDRTTRISTP